jgi:hypothetical protein
MENVIGQSWNFTFAVQSYEHFAPFPEKHADLLKEVRIRLSGCPSGLPIGDKYGGSVEDVHVYLRYYTKDPTDEHKDNEVIIDLTSVFVYEMHELLANNLPEVQERYRRALENWIKLERELGEGYGPTEIIDQDEGLIDTLSKLEPLPDKLGDGNVGWRGNLHIFNFLYTYIPFQPFSLLNIVGRATGGVDALAFLRSLNRPSLIVSAGPCRLVDFVGWQKSRKNMRAATVNLWLEFEYENPLDSEVANHSARIQKLEEDFAELQDSIEYSLDQLHKRLGAGGEIDNALSGTSTFLDNAAKDLEVLLQGVKDHTVSIKGLERDVVELQEICRQIHG